MIDIEKNKEIFKKMYDYYHERIISVTYPEYEIDKISQAEIEKYPYLTKLEILKKTRKDLLKQKYDHSLRVYEVVNDLNKKMENNEEFTQVSNMSALLHDYGRFIQAVLFNSFYEAEKYFKENGLNGHGEVGSRVLFINDEIKNFKINKKYHQMINKTIELHSLPDLSKYNLKIDNQFNKKNIFKNRDLTISCMLQMVKDADTYDILYQRITGEYPIFSKTFSHHSKNKTVKEISKITDIDVDTILKWNNLKDENQTKPIIKLPFEKIDTKMLEVPEKIKENFFEKIYTTDKNKWNLRELQEDTSYNYNSITAMWWSIGQFLGNMNFTATLEEIQENNIIEKIYNLYPEKYRFLVAQMFDFAQEELIEKRINKGKIYAKKI